MPEVLLQSAVPPYLILLSQYALNFGLIDLRDNLIRYLILLALRGSTPESPVNTDGIRHRIASMLNLKELHYPDDVVQKRIDALSEEGRITRAPTGYVIVEEARHQLESDAIRVAEIHTAVLGDLFSSIKRTLQDDEKRTVAAALYDFLGNVFAFDGERFARVFIEQHLEIASPGTVGDLQTLLAESSLRLIPDAELRRDFIKAMEESLVSKSEPWLRFFGTVAQTYRVMAVLNLAPDVSKIQVDSFKNFFSATKIYVDTNVVLQLLLPDSPYHDADVMVIKRLRDFGARCIITEMTRREVLTILKREEFLVKRVPAPAPNLLPKVVTAIKEPFVRAYYSAVLKNPNTKWEYFFARLEEMVNLLSNLYGFEFDPADLSEEMKTDPRFEDALLAVMDEFERLRGRAKSWSAAEHDAFHLLYFSNKQTNEQEPQLFFTADRSLRLIPQKVRGLELGEFAVYQDQLLDITLPFLAPPEAQKTAAQVYGDFFASHFASALSSSIPFEELSMLLRPWMEHDGLSEENVLRILQRTYIQKLAKRADKDISTPEATTEFVDAALIESLKSEMQRERTKEIEALYAQLQSESKKQVEVEVAQINARYRDRLQINTKVVGFLSAHGISTLPDVAIGCSLLPSEVAAALAQLAHYGLVNIYGVGGTDPESIGQQMFNSNSRVRLSTKGHMRARTYEGGASE